MNTQRHLLRFGLLIAVIHLAGCGANAESTVAANASISTSSQPISVRAPLAAPAGWAIKGTDKPVARLTTYRGQTITELEPVTLVRSAR